MDRCTKPQVKRGMLAIATLPSIRLAQRALGWVFTGFEPATRAQIPASGDWDG